MIPIDPPDPPSGNSTNGTVDALLTQYREVRTETRELERGIQRQTFVAVIIVGTIFGYAFSTGTLWLLLVVPLIIGYFIAVVGHTWISVMFLAYHARTIESRIGDRDFSWESKYGEVWDDNDREVLSSESVPIIGQLNWSEFPKLFTVGLVGFLYVCAVGIAIFVVLIETPDPWQIHAAIAAFSGYGVYSVLIGLVGKANQAVERELNQRTKVSDLSE